MQSPLYTTNRMFAYGKEHPVLSGTLVIAAATAMYGGYRYYSREIQPALVVYTPLFDGIAPPQMYMPQNKSELQQLVRRAAEEGKKISLVGAGKSQGGQTITDASGAYRISLEGMNHLLELDHERKMVRVEVGMTWRQLQELIAPHGLAVKAMQSYNDFSIGGSLSVNVHGQDLATGQLIRTVRAIKLITPDGELITVSRTEHKDLFNLVIGGYGLLGVIVEVTLELADDILLQRHVTVIETGAFADYFEKHIRNNKHIEFYSARFVVAPLQFLKKACVITYEKVAQPEPGPYELKPLVTSYIWRKGMELMASWSWLKQARYIVSQLFFKNGSEIISRNNFLNYSIQGLAQNTESHQYILQEYFIPYDRVVSFLEELRVVSLFHHINLLNITARHVYPDSESTLSFAPQEEMCALVLYICVEKRESAYANIAMWTAKVIDAALSHRGTYYLPYHLLASQEQLEAAYPRWREFCALKRQYDPRGIFSNRLYETYGV